MMVTKGKGGSEEIEEGKSGQIFSDRRLNYGW